MIEWNFPKVSHGQVAGVAQAGIETFNGSEVGALAREICQNSLDAVFDESKPVKVEFCSHTVALSKTPGLDELKKVIDKCYEYWSKESGDKAKQFLNVAKNKLEQGSNFVLRISDYNTTGLMGPYTQKGLSWNSLTKIDGGATKEGDAAGSYGIGKNAPFCTSYFRTVFYRTINRDNEKAAQGIARLLSYPEDLDNPFECVATGIGYYGNSDNNGPIQTISALDEIHKRNDYGTDVFVYGFNSFSTMVKDLTDAVLENFIVTIAKNKLEVKINDKPINRTNLVNYVKDSTNRNVRSAYLTLSRRDNVKEFTLDFHGLGTVKLKVLVLPDEKLNNQILVVRKQGMKLFNMKGFPRVISFTGILELEGKPLNEFFRQMESPAHDDWKPNRIKNPKLIPFAKPYHAELMAWIRNIINQLGMDDTTEEMDVKGLGTLLQGEVPKKNPEQDEDGKLQESLNSSNEEIEIIEIKKSSSLSGVLHSGDREKKPSKAELEKLPGTVDPNGPHKATKHHKTVKPTRKKQEHKGFDDPKGKDTVHTPKNKIKEDVVLKNQRIKKLGNGQYMLIVEVPRDVSSGHIEIETIGENGRYYGLKVTKVLKAEACDNAIAKDGIITFEGMKTGQKAKITLQAADARDFAMRLNIYEHN